MTTAPVISVHELNRRQRAGEPLFLLDVRTESEFILGHLPFTDALIPYDELPESIGQLPADRNTFIFAFCRSGRRSDFAAQYLSSIGYCNVFNVAGGIIAWHDAGFETVSGK
ncbi:MAG: rhodanese-like domain-containing protein [Candidatus Zixiibacteriota bacterium]